MAINGVYNQANYYRFMSKMQSSNNLSSAAMSNVSRLVSSQFDSSSKLQNIISDRYSQLQKSMQQLSSYQSSAKSFYTDFGKVSSNLIDSSKKLSSALKTTGSTTDYGSSNQSVLSITGGGMVGTGSLDVSVSQIATAQKQQSKSFASNMGYTLGGQSQLSITSKGKTTNLSFNISNTTNNKDALTQIAGQINSAKVGVTASIETKNGMSSLTLTSNDTGKANEFTASFSGNLSKLSMEQTSAAQDAKYKVDGQEFTSASNSVKLGDTGLTAKLEGTGRANIERGLQNSQNITDTVKAFVADYNKASSFLSENAGKSTAISNLAYSYGSTRFQASSLDKIGITTNAKGQMTVNEQRLETALAQRPDETRKLLNNLSDNAKQRTQAAVTNAAKLYEAPKFDSSQGYSGVYNSYNQFMQSPNSALNLMSLFL